MKDEESLTIVDAHTHLYECFGVSSFIEEAYDNLESNFDFFGQADTFTGTLLLMDTAETGGFKRVSNYFKQPEDSPNTGLRTWELNATGEEVSLHLTSGRDESLIIIAGRQLVSQEKLEVLAVGTRRRFDEGQPAKKLIRDIAEVGAIPIIPWGVGKWFGRRGRLLEKLIRNSHLPQFFLGDSGNRPVFWPRPKQFRRAEEVGIRNLPGSDPLPFPEEIQRVGQFGFALNGSLDLTNPAQDLRRRLLASSPEIHLLGENENVFRFLWNQSRMQFRR